jgi:hypothetical protein
MNTPSVSQRIGRIDEDIWAAPAKVGRVNSGHASDRSVYTPYENKASVWSSVGTLDNDVPTLKDDFTSDDSHDTEFNDTLDAMFEDYIWPHPDSLAHISLHDEHVASDWKRTPWSRETVPSTYSLTWLPVWDERDEDARFWRNTKDPKVPASRR